MKALLKKLERLQLEISPNIDGKNLKITSLHAENIDKDFPKEVAQTIHQISAILQEILENGDIDYKTWKTTKTRWGKSGGKSYEHLLQEAVSGETTFSQDTSGRLLRQVSLANIEITYKNLKLVEERQIFEDGRVRIRDLSATVTEKIFPGETPLEAIKRGLEEELGIDQINSLIASGTSEESVDSPSYPGLKSQYTVHSFKTTLGSDQFSPEGYIERNQNEGITAFFKWKKKGKLTSAR